MQSITEYWKSLTTTRKSLLVIGLIAMSPLIATVLVIAGCAEAFKCITKISF